jgi:hypothetical protein
MFSEKMTRSSSSRKNKYIKRHSKFSMMHKKLTLKPRSSPISRPNVQFNDDVDDSFFQAEGGTSNHNENTEEELEEDNVSSPHTTTWRHHLLILKTCSGYR